MTMDDGVGIVGGTGPMGRGLALRLAAAGRDVLLGSRDEERAASIVADLHERFPDAAARVTGVANADACTGATTVLLAAPWAASLELAVAHAEVLAGRQVVSVANALTRSGGAFLPLTMPRGSVTAEVQARLPDAAVTGAFHHLPAGPLADLDRDLEADVLVVGDDPVARAATLDLVESIAGLRGIDAGGLESAGPVEATTAVLVTINAGYRTHSTVRLGGRLDGGGPARAARGHSE